MQITVTNRAEITGAPDTVYDAIVDRLTIENPKYVENETHGRWNGKTPRYLRFYEETRDGISVPRGFTRQAAKLGQLHGVKVEDQTRELEPVSSISTERFDPTRNRR